MKRRISLSLSLALLLLCAACGSGGGTAARSGGSSSATVSDVLASGMSGGGEQEVSAPQETQTRSTASADPEAIDLDLTSLSSTMVYSEVYNMMNEPEGYVGKTVKMGGTFASYHDEDTGSDYYSCIIQDATACCAQGIEFILTDDYNYPSRDGVEITVSGVFDTYIEGNYSYCTLREAKLL